MVSLLTGYAFATAIIGGAVFVDRVLYGGPDEQRLALGALAGATAVGALVSGLLVRFVSLRLITLVGLAAQRRRSDRDGVVDTGHRPDTVAAALGAFGFGFGLTVTPRSTAAVEAAGRRSFGVASAVVTVARMLGMAVGLAILTAYGSTTIDRLAQQVYATPDAYLQFIPEELRDRPLRDPLVVNALEEWASREAARIMVGLFVVAAGVTARRDPAGAAPGRPSREPAGYAGRRLGRARHRTCDGRARVRWSRPRWPRTDRIRPRALTTQPGRDLPAKRGPPGEPRRASPATVRISVMDGDACRESEGPTALDGLPEILRAAEGGGLGRSRLADARSGPAGRRPRSTCTRSSSRTSSRETSGPRSRQRGRRPHRPVRPRVRRTRSSPPRSISSSGRVSAHASTTGAGIRATRAISEAVSGRSSSAGPDHLLWAHRRRHRRRLLPLRRPAGRRDRRRPGPGRRKATPDILEQVFELKRELIEVRRAVSPVREVFNQLTNRDEALIDAEELVYFRDIYDHVIRLTDELDNYRELAASTLDVYLTQVNNSLSVIMKRLTGVTVILAGIGAVAGIFGMSEAGTALGGKEAGGFWAVTAIVIALAVGAAVILRRIDWI